MCRLGLIRVSTLLSLLFASVTPEFARAQIVWGGLRGEVTDLAGAAIPGAAVSVASPSAPRGMSTVSDVQGNYIFAALPVGTYVVSVSAPGFHTLRYHNLEVRLGSVMTFHARLSLGAVTESIEVNDSLQALDTSSSRTVTSITASEFDNIARGRSFHTLLLMAPGVRHEAKSGAGGVGGITVDGASGSENTYFIDGIEVSDVLTGALRQQSAVPFEFVRTMQVQSGGFEAEFGGTTGGVVSVATRGGTNQVHGEAVLNVMDGRWNASDRAYWQRSPLDPAVADFIRPGKDDYRILYPGFSLGGPVLRNRLFAYGSYMPELERTRRTIDYQDGRRTWNASRVRHYALGRLDASPVRDVQLNTSWVWSPMVRTGTLPVRDPRVQAPLNTPSNYQEMTPSQTFSASGNWTAGAATLVSARYGYTYLNGKTNNAGLTNLPFILYRSPSLGVPNIPRGLQAGAGFQTTGGAYVVERDIRTRHNLFLDGSHVTTLFGQQHILKGGYMMNRVYNDVADSWANGRFDVFWNESFSRGSVFQQRGRYGYYVWEDGPRLNSEALGHSYGVYLQDTWRALPTLTINAGVRLEREYMPPYTRDFEGISIANPIDFGWGDKIAPRLGAAWDVRGDGRWKLSGSFGLFYDTMKYNMARTAFGGTKWFSHVYRLDDPDVLRLGLSNPGALGEKIASWNNLSMPVNQRGEWQGIDPSLQPFTSREITLSLDRRITSRLNASVRYTRKDLLRTIEDIGVLDEHENEIYLIGNPGFGLTRNASSMYGGRTPDGREWLVPRATRRYDGLEFRLQGSIRAYHVIASYTCSRLYGNFSGLANSDEAGRMDPSLSRSFDLPTYYFDSTGSQRTVEGRLATDRPHATKLFAWREVKSRVGATSIGVTQLAMSGAPDSTTVMYLTAPTFPHGRGDMGRQPFYTQTDLNVTHTFRLHERASLKLEATAMNLLNQAAVLSRVTQMNWNGAITSAQLPVSKFYSGWNVANYAGPGSAIYNPIYGLPGADPVNGGYMYGWSGRSDASSAFLAQNPAFGAYQGPRTLRLGVRVVF